MCSSSWSNFWVLRFAEMPSFIVFSRVSRFQRNFLQGHKKQVRCGPKGPSSPNPSFVGFVVFCWCFCCFFVVFAVFWFLFLYRDKKANCLQLYRVFGPSSQNPFLLVPLLVVLLLVVLLLLLCLLLIIILLLVLLCLLLRFSLRYLIFSLALLVGLASLFLSQSLFFLLFLLSCFLFLTSFFPNSKSSNLPFLKLMLLPRKCFGYFVVLACLCFLFCGCL